jgi:hypothetical protein
MANLTLSIPDDLYEEMKKHPEIRWSEVARQSLRMKLQDLRRLDELLGKSRLTGGDVQAVGEKVKEAVWRRHGKRPAAGSR